MYSDFMPAKQVALWVPGIVPSSTRLVGSIIGNRLRIPPEPAPSPPHHDHGSARGSRGAGPDRSDGSRNLLVSIRTYHGDWTAGKLRLRVEARGSTRPGTHRLLYTAPLHGRPQRS